VRITTQPPRGVAGQPAGSATPPRSPRARASSLQSLDDTQPLLPCAQVEVALPRPRLPRRKAQAQPPASPQLVFASAEQRQGLARCNMWSTISQGSPLADLRRCVVVGVAGRIAGIVARSGMSRVIPRRARARGNRPRRTTADLGPSPRPGMAACSRFGSPRVCGLPGGDSGVRPLPAGGHSIFTLAGLTGT
jgi:hypothetical protein